MNALFYFLFSLSYILSSNGLSYPQWEHGRTEIEMEDINNDGKIDLLTIGDHGSPYVNTQEHGIMVYFGDGYGNWQNYMNGDFGYGGIAIGDVNNDGHKDVGYAMHHNYSNWELIANNLPDNGRYQWRIPLNYSSNNCYIRYTLKVQNDSVIAITPSAFSIIPVSLKENYRIVEISEFKESIWIDKTGRIFVRNPLKIFKSEIYFIMNKEKKKIKKIIYLKEKT